MNLPPEDLLERLSSGDMEAAERVFVAYEPYLRLAIRRHLSAPFRAKFDSADIVQSTWADLLRGFREAGWRFADVDHLSGFLFVATRNRLIDRMRQYRQAVHREVPLEEGHQQELLPSPKPRPIEVAQANEMWERILTVCSLEHRSILVLRRKGHSLAEIAGRTGLHPDSVRRVLRNIARRVAFEQKAAEAE
jgi:RNA polymerase sigma factor (sigma-70 family)